MADNVQWIKLKVGMFDGESFKKIKRAKIGGVSYRDKLTAVWFELLDLAAKSNHGGFLIDGNEIPYHTFDDIATMIDRDEKEVELCMGFFVRERMVEIIDDIYCLPNWAKYQSVDGLDKIREQNRLRKAKQREKNRQIQGNVLLDCESHVTRHVTGHADVTQPSFENKEKELDIYKEKTVINDSRKQMELAEPKSALSAPEKPPKPKKHKYGKYKNILLTEEEHAKLLAIPNGDKAIEYLSEYREYKGYKAKNDYLAIRKWVFNALKEEEQRANRNEKKDTLPNSSKNFDERTYSQEQFSDMITDIGKLSDTDL